MSQAEDKDQPLIESIDSICRRHTLWALDYLHGNRTHAAFRLGISLRTLRNKLARYQSEGHEVPKPIERKKKDER